MCQGRSNTQAQNSSAAMGGAGFSESGHNKIKGGRWTVVKFFFVSVSVCSNSIKNHDFVQDATLATAVTEPRNIAMWLSWHPAAHPAGRLHMRVDGAMLGAGHIPRAIRTLGSAQDEHREWRSCTPAGCLKPRRGRPEVTLRVCIQNRSRHLQSSHNTGPKQRLNSLQMYYLPSIPLLAVSSAVDEPLDNYFGALAVCFLAASYADEPLHVLTGAMKRPRAPVITQSAASAGVAKTVLMRLIIGMGGCFLIAIVFPLEPNRLGCAPACQPVVDLPRPRIASFPWLSTGAHCRPWSSSRHGVHALQVPLFVPRQAGADLAHGVSFSASYQLVLECSSDDIGCSMCHRLLLGTITRLGLAHGVSFFATYQPKLTYHPQPLFYRP